VEIETIKILCPLFLNNKFALSQEVMLDKTKAFLSDKRTSVISILIAIAARIALQLYFFDIGGDRSFQLVAAKSFIEGHNFSIPQVLPDNLYKQVYRPVIGWPPGYSLFLSLLFFISNKNIITAAIAFEILTAVLFIIFLRMLLKLLNQPVWVLNAYTLLSGFFIYDFAAASTTDFHSLTFFVFGIYCLFFFIKSNTITPLFGVLIGVILFLCPLTRYMYTPVVLIPPLYLLWTGYTEKNKRFVAGGFYCLVTLIFLLGGFYLFQYDLTGSASYIIPSKKGFYPSNLLRTSPVMFSAFMNLQVFCIALHSLFGFDYVRQIETIWHVHLIPFAAVLIYVTIYLIGRIKRKRTIVEHYVYLGLLSSLCIIFLLVYLSLRNAAILTVTYPIWTFVEEPRYYAFVLLFIHQLVFIFLFNPTKRTSNLQKIFTVTFALLLGFQLLHGGYLITKKLIAEHHDFTIRKSSKATNQFFTISLDSLQHQHPQKKVVAVSNDRTFQNLAALKEYNALYEVGYLNDTARVKSNKNIVFLVVLQGPVRSFFKNFLQLSNTRFIGSVGRYYFYTLET